MATGGEATTSSHIEEMIQELAWQEGLEVPAARGPHEDATPRSGNPHPQVAYLGICHLQILNLIRGCRLAEYSPFHYYH